MLKVERRKETGPMASDQMLAFQKGTYVGRLVMWVEDRGTRGKDCETRTLDGQI